MSLRLEGHLLGDVALTVWQGDAIMLLCNYKCMQELTFGTMNSHEAPAFQDIPSGIAFQNISFQ